MIIFEKRMTALTNEFFLCFRQTNELNLLNRLESCRKVVFFKQKALFLLRIWLLANLQLDLRHNFNIIIGTLFLRVYYYPSSYTENHHIIPQ